MKLQLTIGKWPWDAFTKRDSGPLKKLRAEMIEMFARYEPKRLAEEPGHMEYLEHIMEVPADDPDVETLLKALHQKVRRFKPRMYALAEWYPTGEELKRARFMKLTVFGGTVDDEGHIDKWPNRGRWPVVCKECRFPNLTRVPDPLYVGKTVLKKQEVFSTSTGMLVVRPRVLDLLKKAIGNQIEIGTALLAGSKSKPTGDDRLFWARPKEMIGDQTMKCVLKRCRHCKRPLECRSDTFEDVLKRSPGLCDQRHTLEHFGRRKSDLAVLGGYFGEVRDDEEPAWFWSTAISGALFAHLKSNGVTGIAVACGSDPAECYRSAKGDPTLEPRVRTFGPIAASKTTRQENSRIEQGRQISASLKHIPWDCDQNGYVYFYLTSPELVVLDPMSWECDSNGAYQVKKFKKPGLYRLSVSAIRRSTDEDNPGVAVDSASLLFVDNAFFAGLQDVYEWDQTTSSSGRWNEVYLNRTAESIGSRFGICSPPPMKFKSQFDGDGFYHIDPNGIEPA